MNCISTKNTLNDFWCHINIAYKNLHIFLAFKEYSSLRISNFMHIYFRDHYSPKIEHCPHIYILFTFYLSFCKMNKVSVPHLLCSHFIFIILYDIIIDSALLVTTKHRIIIQIYIYIF